MQYYYANLGKENWASHVKTILFSVGFPEAWYNQGVGNVNMFLSQFSQRVRDISIQDWHAQCTEMSKLSYYSSFKTVFECEHYIQEVHVLKHRRALAWLRCCNHNLQVECGRRQGVEKENRLCLLCKSGKVEVEFHFTLVCTFYNQIRDSYLPSKFTRQPNKHMFTILLSSKNATTVRALAAFIFHAFKLRTAFLNVSHIM
jgi:hypothetical protein